MQRYCADNVHLHTESTAVQNEHRQHGIYAALYVNFACQALFSLIVAALMPYGLSVLLVGIHSLTCLVVGIVLLSA